VCRRQLENRIECHSPEQNSEKSVCTSILLVLSYMSTVLIKLCLLREYLAKSSHSYMFRHYHIILRELVINTLPSYTSISNAAVGNTIYN
jgi:hypothetical protein